MPGLNSETRSGSKKWGKEVKKPTMSPMKVPTTALIPTSVYKGVKEHIVHEKEVLVIDSEMGDKGFIVESQSISDMSSPLKAGVKIRKF